MKFRKTPSVVRQSLPLFGIGICLFCGCNKTLTQQDVRDQLEDAQKATLEAQTETKEAITDREQFYDDYRETKIKELEDRSNSVDKRIKDLRKTARKSENQSAVADIKAAISELQREKKNINNQISDVRAIQAKDWSASYDEVDQAIARIEGEIDKLSRSLNSNN